jgi:(1->4)-alpha-D-glucan 1-alpha-D-glucosylmutase
MTPPVSTYRLQLSRTFTFVDAASIVDYLSALGITHCYTSSYFAAVPGSTHGYDVVDPTRLNPEIGDEQTYGGWIDALRAQGMGHIIDLVPNHMGIARSANPWWQDVLENGEASRYADIFDIDWAPLKTEMAHQVLLPVLGDVYGAALERQELVLEYGDGAFKVRYFDSTFPIAPNTYDAILDLAREDLLNEVGVESETGIEFLSILTAIKHLPGSHGLTSAQQQERDREKEVIKRRLGALTSRAPEVLAHVRRVVDSLNGVPGKPPSFDGLDTLLSKQAYRLAYWRVAAEEINYRRFFDINELAAIRMEDLSVFERVHAFAFELLARGAVDGFRIDHVDGLYDPGDYLRRLRARAHEVRPDLYTDDHPLYLVVEKILGRQETLPAWPVEGTTGYDFLVMLNGLFVDGGNERGLNTVYEQFSRLRDTYREIAYRGRQLILRVSMASELNVLAHRLNRLSERHRHYRDFTPNSLSQAMREIIACFPVYRTYVNERDASVEPRDRAAIERAASEAKKRNPNRPAAVYDFVTDVLLRRAAYIPDAERDEQLRFIGKFQQVTSPVTAKGIEDTALYVYNRLVSLNEVGGEPDRFGASPGEVHGWLEARARQWPHGMSTTSTHDTKRSEDVRARLNVLSEIPGAWKQAAARWARLNRRGRSIIDDQSYPSRNEEYLFYQTLLGSWPLEPMSPALNDAYTARIVEYMLKAMREAKVFTSWLNPSVAHEQAMTRFVTMALAPGNQEFRTDFLEFEERLARLGIYNSLSQLTVKIAAPGVPDFYQGTELWDFSLVDPDNRRPVDYDRRRSLLADLDARAESIGRVGLTCLLMANPTDDRLKIYVTSTLLRYRRERRRLFEEGHYVALPVEGRRDHVFAFARSSPVGQAITVVPRLVAALTPDGAPPLGERTWGDTRLEVPTPAPVAYRQVLTGRCVPVVQGDAPPHVLIADVFADLPVAVLEADHPA